MISFRTLTKPRLQRSGAIVEAGQLATLIGLVGVHRVARPEIEGWTSHLEEPSHVQPYFGIGVVPTDRAKDRASGLSRPGRAGEDRSRISIVQSANMVRIICSAC